MASIVYFSDKLNSGQYLECNDYLLVRETDTQPLPKKFRFDKQQKSMHLQICSFFCLAGSTRRHSNMKAFPSDRDQSQLDVIEIEIVF